MRNRPVLVRPRVTITGSCLVLAVVLVFTAGCSFLTKFDRSKIEKTDSGMLEADGGVDAAVVVDAGHDSGSVAGHDAGAKDAAVPVDAATANVDGSVDQDAGATSCTDVNDCPGSDTPCRTRSCMSNKCTAINMPLHAGVVGQTVGDCKKIECDGKGATTSINDDTDVENDDQMCTVDSCASGVPQHMKMTDGIACTDHGGGKCMNGACAGQCTMAAQCGANTACKTFKCTTGQCGSDNVAVNTALPAGMQTAGDCQEVQCDGNGATMMVAKTSDTPSNDNNDCTQETCNGSMPHPFQNAGTACAQSGGHVCNNSGACIPCTTDANCSTAGDGSLCLSQTCASPGALTALSVNPTTYTNSTINNNMSFTFTLQNKLPRSAKILITFPTGFGVGAAAFGGTPLTGADGTPAIANAGQVVTVTRTSGTTTNGGTTIIVALTGINMPTMAQTPSGMFTIATQTSGGAQIDSGTIASVTVN